MTTGIKLSYALLSGKWLVNDLSYIKINIDFRTRYFNAYPLKTLCSHNLKNI